ncbi:MAG: hypothetical protein ACREQD_12850 [Candidatus Binataceae bacterium]
MQSRLLEDTAKEREKFRRLDPSRLARECEKLDVKAEKVLADEGLAHDLAEWPEY